MALLAGAQEQQVAVEAQQHGQAGVELPQGGSLHVGLQRGRHRGQGQRLQLLLPWTTHTHARTHTRAHTHRVSTYILNIFRNIHIIIHDKSIEEIYKVGEMLWKGF